MDVIIELADFVISSISFFLMTSLIIWIFCRPLVISYRLSPDGIDIMLLSFHKLYHIDFRDITDIRVIGNMSSELAAHNRRHLFRTTFLLDKLYPKQIMVITTTNGKIKYWILSTTPLDYIRDYTNKDDGA